MKTVLVFGCFDIIHPGHIWFLQQAKKHGDHLVVVLARDNQIRRIKGHAPQIKEQDRLALVKALKLVDAAYLGDNAYRYERLVKKIKSDIIVLGYDQKETIEEIQARVGTHIRIVRLKAYKPKKYKSSLIYDRH